MRQLRVAHPREDSGNSGVGVTGDAGDVAISSEDSGNSGVAIPTRVGERYSSAGPIGIEDSGNDGGEVKSRVLDDLRDSGTDDVFRLLEFVLLVLATTLALIDLS